MKGIRRLAWKVALAALTITSSREAAAQPFSTGNPARILAVGDSILNEAKYPLTQALDATGKARVTSHALSGSALCSWFDDSLGRGIRWDQALKRSVATLKPHAIIMQFWGNDDAFGTNPCMAARRRGTREYFAKYEGDTYRAMQLIQEGARQAGIAMPLVFWVKQPPQPPLGGVIIERTPRELDNRYYYGVGDLRGRARFPDAGREVSAAMLGGDRYGYVLELPCLFFETADKQQCGVEAPPGYNRVRDHALSFGDERGIHFCPVGANLDGTCSVFSSGALRYGYAIANDIIDELRLR